MTLQCGPWCSFEKCRPRLVHAHPYAKYQTVLGRLQIIDLKQKWFEHRHWGNLNAYGFEATDNSTPYRPKTFWQKASLTVRFSKVKILSTLGTENKWNLKLLSCVPYILLGRFLYIPPNISFLSVFGKKDWFWVEVYAWNHSRLMMTLLGQKTVKPDRMSGGFYLELL